MAQQVDMSRPRVLLVEDEVVVAVLVQDMLEDAGYDVAGPASSVAEALALVEREDLDCAVLDVQLGDGRIYPVADALRARGCPMVFCTGYGRGVLRDVDQRSPMLQKPVSPDQLGRTVRGLVADPRAARLGSA